MISCGHRLGHTSITILRKQYESRVRLLGGRDLPNGALTESRVRFNQRMKLDRQGNGEQLRQR